MKSFFIIFCLLLIPHSGFGASPLHVQIPVKKIYVPNGFDTNDSVEVLVSAQLPNLCYRSPQARVKQINQDISISVTATYDIYRQGECAQVVVPKLIKVDLGVLDKNTYALHANEAVHASLQIKESTSSAVDDHIYANVEYIEPNDANRKVKLVGTHPNNCLQLKKVQTVQMSEDTISVLPILERVTDVECEREEVPFEIEWEVPRDLEATGVLIHVRKMDGRSVNHLYRNKI